MTKSPDGTTTTSGQSLQSLNISPGSGLFPWATTASVGGAGGGLDAAGGVTVNPRWASARGLATATSAVRSTRNNRCRFMLSLPTRTHPGEASPDPLVD